MAGRYVEKEDEGEDEEEDDEDEDESGSARCAAKSKGGGDGDGDGDGDDENMLEKNPGGLRGRGLLGASALESGEENLRRRNATSEKDESSSDEWSVKVAVAGDTPPTPPTCTVAVAADIGDAARSAGRADTLGIRRVSWFCEARVAAGSADSVKNNATDAARGAELASGDDGGSGSAAADDADGAKASALAGIALLEK